MLLPGAWRGSTGVISTSLVRIREKRRTLKVWGAHTPRLLSPVCLEPIAPHYRNLLHRLLYRGGIRCPELTCARKTPTVASFRCFSCAERSALHWKRRFA